MFNIDLQSKYWIDILRIYQVVKLLLGMPPNGPAVCFSKRNPTTAPGRVLVL